MKYNTNVVITEAVEHGKGLRIENLVILGKASNRKKSGENKLKIGKNGTFKTGTIIYLGSDIGDYFEADEYVLIYPNVKLGSNVKIGAHSVIGVPIKDQGEITTVIGDNSTIRSHTVIYAGNRIGRNFNCGHGAIIREFTIIGDDSQVGTFSQIEGYSEIGNHVKLHTNVHIGQYSKIEDHVFIAPGTVLTNTLHPLCPKVKECIKGPTIRSHVKIGSNVTVSPTVEIKENSVIGSGANVTKNVPPNSVVVGNPGKVIKKIHDLTCPFNIIEKPYSLEHQNITIPKE